MRRPSPARPAPWQAAPSVCNRWPAPGPESSQRSSAARRPDSPGRATSGAASSRCRQPGRAKCDGSHDDSRSRQSGRERHERRDEHDIAPLVAGVMDDELERARSGPTARAAVRPASIRASARRYRRWRSPRPSRTIHMRAKMSWISGKPRRAFDERAEVVRSACASTLISQL